MSDPQRSPHRCTLLLELTVYLQLWFNLCGCSFEEVESRCSEVVGSSLATTPVTWAVLGWRHVHPKDSSLLVTVWWHLLFVILLWRCSRGTLQSHKNSLHWQLLMDHLSKDESRRCGTHRGQEESAVFQLCMSAGYILTSGELCETIWQREADRQQPCPERHSDIFVPNATCNTQWSATFYEMHSLSVAGQHVSNWKF